MSKRTLVAVFEQEADLLRAVVAVRAADLRIGDVHTPYAVHGLDRALGWRPSRLSWACAFSGLAGAIFMLWFQWWTSAVSWPLNVGGKPWNSLPAFVPIIFEGMVLAAGLGTVFALLVVARLRPGKKMMPIIPGVMDDRFALLVEETDATFDARAIDELLRGYRAVEVAERVLEDESPPLAEARGAAATRLRRRLNYVLLLVLAVVVAMNFLALPNPSQPNREFLPDMAHSPAYTSESANPNFPDGETLQRPVLGTLVQGQMPLHYAATDDEALRAGRELHNPLSAKDVHAGERGALVFQTFCTPCHGGGGQGDGTVALRGYPAPPSLVTGNTTKMPDGQLFHIITYGRVNMPSQSGLLSPQDRWAAILHIRSLQTPAAPKPTGAKP
jgi:mono/diheme cytochrome c family protein